MLMFGTSFSYEVENGFRALVAELPDWPPDVRFDKLLGFTHAIDSYDHWVVDHEVGWEGPAMLSALGGLWKVTLAESDARLKIDAEFTRPGVECFLDAFKAKVDAIDEDYESESWYDPVSFDWQ